jgi:hypothetical protein
MRIKVSQKETPRIKEPLTKRDRCDACGAQAKVRVVLEQGELLFCNHHYNQHAQALEDKQVEVNGEE